MTLDSDLPSQPSARQCVEPKKTLHTLALGFVRCYRIVKDQGTWAAHSRPGLRRSIPRFVELVISDAKEVYTWGLPNGNRREENFGKNFPELIKRLFNKILWRGPDPEFD